MEKSCHTRSADSTLDDSGRSESMNHKRRYEIDTLALESLPSPFSSPCAFREDYTLNEMESASVRYFSNEGNGYSTPKEKPLGSLQDEKQLSSSTDITDTDNESCCGSIIHTSINDPMYQPLTEPPEIRRSKDKGNDTHIRRSVLESLPLSIGIIDVKRNSMCDDDQGDRFDLPAPPSSEDSTILVHTKVSDTIQKKKNKKSPHLQIQRSRSTKYYEDVDGTVRKKKAPTKAITLEHLFNAGSNGHLNDDASVISTTSFSTRFIKLFNKKPRDPAMVELVINDEKDRHRSELISRIHRDRQYYLGENCSSSEFNVTTVKRVNQSNPKAIPVSTESESCADSSKRSRRKGRKSIRQKNGTSRRPRNQNSNNPTSKRISRNKDSNKSKKNFGKFFRRKHNQRKQNDLDIDDDENDYDKPSVHYPIIHFQCSRFPSTGSPTRSTSSTDYDDRTSCISPTSSLSSKNSINESLDCFLNRRSQFSTPRNGSPRISSLDSTSGYGSDSNSSFASSCNTAISKKSQLSTPRHRAPRISSLDSTSGYSGYGSDSNSSFASSCYTEVRDPCAKRSRTAQRANLGSLAKEGDGDVWVEKVFRSKTTGKLRIYFVSMATGRRSRDEPPTGASRVIYAEDMIGSPT